MPSDNAKISEFPEFPADESQDFPTGSRFCRDFGFSKAQGSNTPLLGGRLARSGVIYWSQCVEGSVVVYIVYIGC